MRPDRVPQSNERGPGFVSVGETLLQHIRESDETSGEQEAETPAVRWFASIIDHPETTPLPHNKLPVEITVESVGLILRAAEASGQTEDVKVALQLAMRRQDGLTSANWKRLFPNEADWAFYSEGIVGPEALAHNVEIVETNQGKFRVVYGAHYERQDPADLGLNYSGAVLETGIADYLTPAGLKEFLEVAESNPIEKQLADVMKRLAQDNRPVFLGDIAESQTLLPAMTIPAAVETLLAGAIGAASLVELNEIRKKHQTKPFSRRDFFKLAAAGAAVSVVETYLASPVVTEASLLAAEMAGKKLTPEAMHLQEEIHPEVFALLVTLRNFIFASKLEAIQEHDKVPFPEAELAIILGAAHSGVEDALRMDPQVRTKAIEDFLSYLPMLDREKISKIVRLDYNTDTAKWDQTEIFDDPKLKV